MEFHEKLQELRKQKNLTQEEHDGGQRKAGKIKRNEGKIQGSAGEAFQNQPKTPPGFPETPVQML